jgi:hypothetical protein
MVPSQYLISSEQFTKNIFPLWKIDYTETWKLFAEIRICQPSFFKKWKLNVVSVRRNVEEKKIFLSFQVSGCLCLYGY